MVKSKPVIAIDFDDTIVEWVNESHCVLKEGVAEAFAMLKAEGFSIVIHSCRIGIAKESGQLEGALSEMRDILDNFSIPYDSIHLGTKVVADVYIDDRAIPYRGNWEETCLETRKFIRKKLSSS